jgi:hypothetical protein
MDLLEKKVIELEKRIAALEREVAVLSEGQATHAATHAAIPVQKRRRLDSMSLDLASDSNL